MEEKKYIILELIPTTPNRETGKIVQLSALKLNGFVLEERFDYRLESSKINNKDLIGMISYDSESFKYVADDKEIIDDFKKWIEDYDLLIIDNLYTKSYLGEIENKKESIFKYLDMEYSDDVIDKVIDKYKLEESNYIVDLLYEALIFESNNKQKLGE